MQFVHINYMLMFVLNSDRSIMNGIVKLYQNSNGLIIVFVFVKPLVCTKYSTNLVIRCVCMRRHNI